MVSFAHVTWLPVQRACHGDHAYRELERPSVLEGDDAMGVPRHSLTSLGQVVDASCGCQKSTCCALGVVDRREAAGYRYVPDPIDTSSVHMDLNPQVRFELWFVAPKCHRRAILSLNSATSYRMCICQSKGSLAGFVDSL